MSVDTSNPPAPRRPNSLGRGVWGVVATPFDAGTGAVDAESLARIVQHYERIGVAGLTVLGVFGEAVALSSGERRHVLETVMAATTALPIVVGITALRTEPALEEVLAAQAVVGDRLSAVMIQANSAQAPAVIEHLESIHARSGADIVLQDYPVASGVVIGVPALIDIVRACGFVNAVKAESGPTCVAVAKLVAALDVPVFGGLGGQGLLDELACGAAGAMTGFSYPEALIACVDAHARDGADAAKAALLPYLPLINCEQQAKIALGVRKECLRLRGMIASNHVRLPSAPFPEELRGIVERHVRDAEAQLAAAV